MVSADRSHALFAHVQLDTSVTETAAPLRIPGLDPHARYTLTPRSELSTAERNLPLWCTRPGLPELSLTGRFLAEVGVAGPDLGNQPGQALLLELRVG